MFSVWYWTLRISARLQIESKSPPGRLVGGVCYKMILVCYKADACAPGDANLAPV